MRALEHRLTPWVVCLILALFAFANAGISLQGERRSTSTLGLTTAVGNYCRANRRKTVEDSAIYRVGTEIQTGFCLPAAITFHYISGGLYGIGFTMSIFIANLAFGQGMSG